MEFDEDAPLAQSFKRKRKPIRKKKQFKAQPEEPPEPAHDPDPATANPPPEIALDYSVENHFKAVDTIAKLCGHSSPLDANQPEIKRLSNSITFLREWRDFKYAPRTVRFANQHNSKEKDVVGEVTLHQFSSTSVPKKEMGNRNEAGTEASKDVVMYVGGSVWALDWCPRVDRNSENHIKSEFVAVAAHPPESSYHKIGAPLTGRGTIQIWCLLSVYVKEDVPNPGNKKSNKNSQKEVTVKSNVPTEPPKPRGRPRKEPLNESVPRKPIGRPRKKPLNDSLPPRPRGRPRNKPLNDSVEKIDNADQYVQPLAIEYPMSSAGLHSSDGLSVNSHEHIYDEDSVNTNEASSSNQIDNSNLLLLTAPKVKGKKAKARKKDQALDNAFHIPRQREHEESASFSLDSVSPDKNIACISACDANISQIPIDVELPRLVLCLAHNGKVAWDVKWRPVNARHPESMHVMGYLAVLLGNGALEVWEVPLPHTVKLVYPTSQKHIDPRFMKLKPVFRSSKLKCGDRQSIPLTMEWSVSLLSDMILAGCHDGVVALWKFSVTDPLTETRPLLSFSTETGPIRTLAWAPIQSDLESANIFATAGNKGLKLWDLRDPFRPLREYPIQGGIFGLAWLPHLRCILGVVDEGILWSLNLEKTANDIPVTGKSLTVTSRPSLNSFDCSSFSIWCVQASRLTGVVAYCGEDGTTSCFWPNTKSAKDPRRGGVHHFLCGSLLEEGPALVVASPSTNSSLSKRLPIMKNSRAQENTRANKKIGQGSDDTATSKSKQSEEVKKHDEVESFPPKIVAMHRVRWNVNKGSERWLCYGGAAGLVRCQKIDFFQ
ncbi:hypothetical protein PHJA_001850300 [Phtheirospermum japonicum]|uniref:Transducin/WD40 repeat-like superfamily protein n=1 Tax=Phtheirospermum japonicum TaxID=374723 RepID=A0A830CFH5_9LAMI|nr:hypothetical protein PHJA_001850300 [Phtheirospermum japonicum]